MKAFIIEVNIPYYFPEDIFESIVCLLSHLFLYLIKKLNNAVLETFFR